MKKDNRTGDEITDITIPIPAVHLTEDEQIKFLAVYIREKEKSYKSAIGAHSFSPELSTSRLENKFYVFCDG